MLPGASMQHGCVRLGTCAPPSKQTHRSPDEALAKAGSKLAAFFPH